MLSHSSRSIRRLLCESTDTNSGLQTLDQYVQSLGSYTVHLCIMTGQELLYDISLLRWLHLTKRISRFA